MSVFAFGNSQKPQTQDQAQSQGQSQGQNQGQAQQANAAAIAAAAASNSTVVDMTSVNVIKTDIDNTNVNVAKGGDGGNAKAQGGDAYSGSKSKSNSGGNKISNNVNIEGDKNEYPASSAIAGMSTPCTDALAGQVLKGGISVGGESPDCKALRTAQAYFVLATTFEGTPEGKDYLKKGHYYANRAGVSGFELGIKRVRNVVIDIAILALPFILL